MRQYNHAIDSNVVLCVAFPSGLEKLLSLHRAAAQLGEFIVGIVWGSFELDLWKSVQIYSCRVVS